MAIVYLIPSLLEEEGIHVMPAYITDAINDCQVFFVENERTTRRYFKKLWKNLLPGKELIIDNYEWWNMSDTSKVSDIFRQRLKAGKNIGIVSEAGCPGVADPGQLLIGVAQEMNVTVKPLVGPSSLLLALMASGMNGQEFRFTGYLPIDNQERIKVIKGLETESAKRNSTQIFIETPYRNNQLLDALLKTCNPSTRLCMAVGLTGKNEWVKTKTIAEWKKLKTDIHKRPAIFLIYAGN